MVPHIKVEEEIHGVIGGHDTRVVVSAVPEDKKGEQLVVLYTGELDIASVTKALGERGLPNLWIPKREAFFQIARLPILGTGKLDLKEVKRLAHEFIANKATVSTKSPAPPTEPS